MSTKLYQIVSDAKMPLMMELAVVTIDTATDVFYTQDEFEEMMGGQCIITQHNNTCAFVINETVLLDEILTFFSDPKVKRMTMDSNLPSSFSNKFDEQLAQNGIRYNHNHRSCTRIVIKTGTTKSELLAAKRVVINVGQYLIYQKSQVDFKFVGSNTNDNKLNFIKMFGIEFKELVTELKRARTMNVWKDYGIEKHHTTPLERSVPDTSKHDHIIKELEKWWLLLPQPTPNEK